MGTFGRTTSAARRRRGVRSARTSDVTRFAPVGASGLVFAVAAVTACGGAPPLGTKPSAASDALNRGIVLHRSGHLPEAIGALADACAAEDPCAEALDYVADCFRATRRMEAGAEFCAAVAERYPGLEAEARAYRGYFLEKAGYLREAEREYRRAFALRPTPRSCIWLGNLLLRFEDTGGAIEVYRKGLEAAPGDDDLRYVLARALWRRGRLGEAERLLRAVVEEDPGHARAWSNLGRVWLARGRGDEEAYEAFRRAIVEDPTIVEARYMLARMALRAGRTGEAEGWLEQIRRVEAGAGPGPGEE